MRRVVTAGSIFAMAALMLMSLTTEAAAFRSYLTAFTDQYPATNGSRLDTCGLCHRDFGGGGGGNPFYSDFVSAGGRNNPAAAFQQIENDDSDGDGSTNIEEIDLLFHPGYDCDNYTNTSGAPGDLADYVNPSNPGCGSAVGPQLDVGPQNIAFGTVEVGTSASSTVTATNAGDADLTITAANLTGGNGSTEFTLSGPSTPVVLVPGDSRDWTITYAPVDEGSDSASLSISSDDPGSPNVMVGVSGSGFVAGPVVVDLDIVQFRVTKRVRVERNPTVELHVTVRNQSSVTGDATATVVGMQNGVEVYNEPMTVSDEAGNGRSRYTFPDFTASAGGNIDWTVTLEDADPDVDEETATTLVISSASMAGANLTGANLRGEILAGIDFTGADLRGADLYGTDLSNATGLAEAVTDATTTYSQGTNFAGTGFDPVTAGWTLDATGPPVFDSTVGRMKDQFRNE